MCSRGSTYFICTCTNLYRLYKNLPTKVNCVRVSLISSSSRTSLYYISNITKYRVKLCALILNNNFQAETELKLRGLFTRVNKKYFSRVSFKIYIRWELQFFAAWSGVSITSQNIGALPRQILSYATKKRCGCCIIHILSKTISCGTQFYRRKK